MKNEPLNERPTGAIPRHIAIVMDGNGRWAERRGLSRSEGHIRGSAVVTDVVEAAAKIGVERLTLYCFSNENWKRPRPELDALMSLLKHYLIAQRPTLAEKNVRLRVLGRRAGIPDDVLREMDETIALSSANTGLTLALAINYGARQEIVDAARSIILERFAPAARTAAFRNANAETNAETLDKAFVETGDRTNVETFVESIDEKYFAARLYESDAADPDLLIRTGGEQRLSNYLLWQLSYAELWFTDVLWPDFTEQTLWEAIRAFQKRKRRFGGLASDAR